MIQFTNGFVNLSFFFLDGTQVLALTDNLMQNAIGMTSSILQTAPTTIGSSQSTSRSNAQSQLLDSNATNTQQNRKFYSDSCLTNFMMNRITDKV